eukprot:PITA_34665
MDYFTPYGDAFETTLVNLEKVLEWCAQTNVALSTEKCHMMMTEGIMLGHYISADGFKVDPSKIEVILKIPAHKMQKEDVDFLWTGKCEQAFLKLKCCVSITSVLQGPNWELPFHIATDASDIVGVFSGQLEDKTPYAIYYISKNVTPNIANYLAAGKFPQYLSSKEKRTIIQQISTYTWIDGNLYHTGPDFQIMRCVREDEVFDILKACHEEPCGGHFTDKWTGYKVLSTRYYWLTIFQDAKKFMKGCVSFQRMGQPQQSDEMLLQPQIVLEPFEKWALDFLGPINPSSIWRSYILVCIGYVRKWVKVKALTRTTEQTASDFQFEDIFVQFGIPKDIVIDGGPQFTSYKI